MTYDAFTAQMERIESLKYCPENWQTHWEGLGDVSVSDLERAVSHAAKTCESFPSPAELRRLIVETSPRVGMDEDRSVPLVKPVTVEAPWLSKPIHVTREWTYYCEQCSDTGWESMFCDGDPVYASVFPRECKPWWTALRCQQDFVHQAHEWARHCVCWDSNPAVLKKRERAAQQASHRTAKQDRQ